MQRGAPMKLIEWDAAERMVWHPVVGERVPDWLYCLCTCANGHLSSLVHANHSVAVDGTITPSYVCPHSGCTFHEFVQLLDWSAQ